MAIRMSAYWFGLRLLTAWLRQRAPGSFFQDDDLVQKELNRQHCRLSELRRLPHHTAGWIGYCKN